jgi:hypothetical protein
MKHFWTIGITLISMASCIGQTQKSVDYGFINSGWTYKNAGLKLQYPLPKGWHFLDATSGSYIKVGSDIKKIPAYTTPFQVSIQDFKKSNSEQIATLFAITQLDTSAIFVAKEFDYNADKTITIGLVYSDNTDVYSFLRKTCLECTDENFKDIYLKDVKLGNITFDGYITGVTDNEGHKMGSFFGVKRVGSLYLVCQYKFPDLNSFEAYKNYFKGLAIN